MVDGVDCDGECFGDDVVAGAAVIDGDSDGGFAGDVADGGKG